MDVNLEAAVVGSADKPDQENDGSSTRKVDQALGTITPVLDELSDRELWVVFVRLQQYRLSRITRYEPSGHRR